MDDYDAVIESARGDPPLPRSPGRFPAATPKDYPLARQDQERLLADGADLGSEAAAGCIRAGLIGRAVELYEHGRSILLVPTRVPSTPMTAASSVVMAHGEDRA